MTAIWWSGPNIPSSEYDIVGQRVGGDGTLAGSLLTIENWQYDQVKPKVADNPHRGEYMVVWEDHHWANGAASRYLCTPRRRKRRL